jgi:CMP-N-acetylneuraminic acid synthetase
MSKRPVCIIPARGGSKRFPRKNLALLAGKPLLAYAIEAALASNIFDSVCVSSEDNEIMGVAREYGATPVRREPELASDQAQVRHVCANLLEQFKIQGKVYETFAVLLTTNPLRTAQDIQQAYDIFNKGEANYVMSLVPYSHPPQRAVWAPQGYVEPYFGLEYMKQTQILDPLYRHDGSVIFGKTEVFLREREFYGSKVVPYFIPPERSVDIDTPLELSWAEFLLQHVSSGIKP